MVKKSPAFHEMRIFVASQEPLVGLLFQMNPVYTIFKITFNIILPCTS